MTMDEKKICPNCGHELKGVYAEANYGRVLMLDQCTRCGGLWFDRWELYLLKKDEAGRLDRVDMDSLMAERLKRGGSKMCPVCDVELVVFRDPALPPDSSINRCPLCSGLWLNRGELARYAARRTPAKGRGGGRKGGPGLDTLKRLQKELDPANLAAKDMPHMDLAAPGPGELAKDLAPVILQVLLKLIFKF